jgi:hypothetical protein
MYLYNGFKLCRKMSLGTASKSPRKEKEQNITDTRDSSYLKYRKQIILASMIRILI